MIRLALGGKCGSPGRPPTALPAARAVSRPSKLPSAIAPRFNPERARNVRRLSCCAVCSASTVTHSFVIVFPGVGWVEPRSGAGPPIALSVGQRRSAARPTLLLGNRLVHIQDDASDGRVGGRP